ncbi:MAG: DUF5667 domain-containing protein [Candidatus Ratteibacteria bacterium]
MKLGLSVVFCLLFACNVFAEEKVTLPDDPLYQTKRQMETSQLNATLDPLERAKLHTKFAEERITEVKEMITKGKPEFVKSLLNEYERSVDEAMDEINKAQMQGKRINEALEAVEMSTKKHIEVLTELLTKVPEQAKPAIQHAIEVSKRGRDVAMERLGKIPAGKPEKIEKPEKLGQPEGIGKPGGDKPAGRMSPRGIRHGRRAR